MKIVKIILSNKELNIDKDNLKLTVNVLKETQKLKTDKFQDEMMLEGIAEYIKLYIDEFF